VEQTQSLLRNRTEWTRSMSAIEVTMRIGPTWYRSDATRWCIGSGLNGVTPDDVASHLAAGLHDAVDFDLLHILMLEDDRDSAQPSLSAGALDAVRVSGLDEARSRLGIGAPAAVAARRL